MLDAARRRQSAQVPTREMDAILGMPNYAGDAAFEVTKAELLSTRNWRESRCAAY
jgi:hypothetical protein